LRLKILKKLRTANLNSKFTTSYKNVYFSYHQGRIQHFVKEGA